MSVCVIGVGNPYRGDDAVGLLIARQLAERDIQSTIVAEVGGDATELMDAMGKAPAVIIVDAMQSGTKPGTVHRFDAGTNALPDSLFRSSTHAISVGEAIELCRALNRLPRHVIVYGIEGVRFEPGSHLSSEISGVLNETMERVFNEIQTLQSKIREG